MQVCLSVGPSAAGMVALRAAAGTFPPSKGQLTLSRRIQGGGPPVVPFEAAAAAGTYVRSCHEDSEGCAQPFVFDMTRGSALFFYGLLQVLSCLFFFWGGVLYGYYLFIFSSLLSMS